MTPTPRHWRQAAKIGGIDGIALTKLDVLDGIERLRVCTAYRLDGETVRHLPAGYAAQARVEPQYEEIEGWSESTRLFPILQTGSKRMRSL